MANSKKSDSKKLEDEMIKYYSSMNDSIKEDKIREDKKQEVLETQKRKSRWYMVISLILSLLIVGFYYYITKSPIILDIILFFIIAIVSLSISDYIITKNENRYIDNIKLLFELFGIIILIGQFFLVYNQNLIQEQQKEISKISNEILKQTSQSNQADVMLISSQGYYSYQLNSIVGYNHSKQLAVGIVNLGKTIAPFVQVSLKQDGISGFTKQDSLDLNDSPYFNVKNLKSLDYNSTFFYIYINQKEIDKIKYGENNLSFKIDCTFCKTSELIQNITICLYDKDPLECGEKWRYT